MFRLCTSASAAHKLQPEAVYGVQGYPRRVAPEIQSAKNAQQQAQQAESLSRLQEQLEASQKALEQQKATAQRLEQVSM